MQVLRERLSRVEEELEEGQEERTQKYAELLSKEKTITGHQLTARAIHTYMSITQPIRV